MVKNKLFLFFFIVYTLFLLKLVVFKGPFSAIKDHLKNFDLTIIKMGYGAANFIPFHTLYYYLSLQENAETGFENIGGNILLFIPYGFLLALAFPAGRKIKKLLLLVLLTSFIFELIQLVTATGNFDVDDLLLNLFGGAIGVWLYGLLLRGGMNR